MLNALVTIAAPVLLIFGLYHLFTWFDLFRLSRLTYWKRVGIVALISHTLLVTGFLLFTWFDFESNNVFAGLGLSYSTFLFQHSAFWRLAAILDTAPMVGILAFLMLLDRLGMTGPVLLPAMAILYVVGGAQWYFLGGGIGLLVDRFWNGLKTGEDGEEWFQ